MSWSWMESTIDLIREGTLPIMVPLIAICLGMWILIVERFGYLMGPAWHFFWPPARARVRSLKRSLSDRLELYIQEPMREQRVAVVEVSRKLMTPYARFLLRALGSDDVERAETRELHLAQASVESEMEIERGLLLIATAAKTAPLVGLFGTVVGMVQTFRVMMLASTSDPRALSSGISIALIATEVGLVVSLSGVLSTSWLNRRAQTLLEEIHLAGTRLYQDLRGGNGSAEANP